MLETPQDPTKQENGVPSPAVVRARMRQRAHNAQTSRKAFGAPQSFGAIRADAFTPAPAARDTRPAPGRAPQARRDGPVTPPKPEGDLVADIGVIVRWLWQGKGWMVLSSVIFALLAALVWTNLPTHYGATSSLMIDPRGLQVVENDVTPGGRTGEANIAIVESQKRVLISDAVLSRVVEREQLAAHPEYGAKQPEMFALLKSSLKSLMGAAPDARRPDPALVALRTLRGDVRTARVVGSFVIELSVRAPEPELAADLTNAIAAEYIAYEFESRQALAERATTALTARLDQLRARVVTAEERVEGFKAENGIVGFNGRLSREQQLTEITTRLAAARAATARARGAFEQVQRLRQTGAGPDAISEAVQSAGVRQLRARYAAASQTANALSTQLLPRHPRLVAARAEVSDLGRQIGGELNRIERAARFDLERAEAEEARLTTEHARIVSDATTTSSALVSLRELERDATANRQVFEAFLVRAREIAEQQTLDTSATRILSPAVPPSGASSLSLKMALALGLMLGLAVGAMVALARGIVRDRTA